MHLVYNTDRVALFFLAIAVILVASPSRSRFGAALAAGVLLIVLLAIFGALR